jgi:hypothetical protein
MVAPNTLIVKKLFSTCKPRPICLGRSGSVITQTNFAMEPRFRHCSGMTGALSRASGSRILEETTATNSSTAGFSRGIAVTN